MKPPLKSLLLWVCLPFSALAADQSTPMADIEPQLLSTPVQARKVIVPLEDVPDPAMAGSASDDFAFVNKGPTGNGSTATGPAAAMPYLEGF